MRRIATSKKKAGVRGAAALAAAGAGSTGPSARPSVDLPMRGDLGMGGGRESGLSGYMETVEAVEEETSVQQVLPSLMTDPQLAIRISDINKQLVKVFC
uniref:Uncharacterized protein n=1 Tax=Chromera velia CCMP2878 TaxID=1169474 RepID=A0A0G4H9Q0_9ALVE|eukprot:Cvel_25448.t1-p1 / transcript=Cvel_25448.t1 / gene=Cvel_25448 / organism=Chromera_velia_CCMP2878 / gene_product=hypothetical protein / transcript_product=hypothetical protein / location=Cvel_scaffold2885:797-1090(-) / protein_length=98 / sequence_SO=supercontig / SO=protein_coding / is_pseudo=false